MIPGLPHAGLTELLLLVFAVSGLILHELNLADIIADGLSIARRYERDGSYSDSEDARYSRMNVNFNFAGEFTLVLIQLVLCVVAYRSLWVEPPPPLRYSLIPEQVWIDQHRALLLISLFCDFAGIIARIGRRRLRRLP